MINLQNQLWIYRGRAKSLNMNTRSLCLKMVTIHLKTYHFHHNVLHKIK